MNLPHDETLDQFRLSLRPREAAKALGICERTLWQLARDNAIPHVRLGNGKRQTLLFPIAELRRWLASRCEGWKDADANPNAEDLE